MSRRVKWGMEKCRITIGGIDDQAQVEQKSFQMPPREGFTVAHFPTVADIGRFRWLLGRQIGWLRRAAARPARRLRFRFVVEAKT
jgi:hypothetical protein